MNQFNPDQPPGPTITGIEVTSTEMVYEWEFEKLLPQLQAWYKNGTISPDCVFTAWVGTKKYTVPSWEMFIGLSLEENVLCNKVGEESIGLFTETKDVNKAILQLARETGLDRLKKSLSSNERAGKGRKI